MPKGIHSRTSGLSRTPLNILGISALSSLIRAGSSIYEQPLQIYTEEPEEKETTIPISKLEKKNMASIMNWTNIISLLIMQTS
jgi:hypothetical protein